MDVFEIPPHNVLTNNDENENENGFRTLFKFIIDSEKFGFLISMGCWCDM